VKLEGYWKVLSAYETYNEEIPFVFTKLSDLVLNAKTSLKDKKNDNKLVI